MGRDLSAYEMVSELSAAIEYNQRFYVRHLLETIPVNRINPVNIIDPTWGRRPLYLAVDNDNIEITEMLLDNGADPNIEEDILHVAVAHGSLEMVKLLLYHEVDVNRIMKSSNKSALHIAVQTNQTSIATLLLCFNANMSLSKEHKETLLYMALVNENETLSLILAMFTPKDQVDFPVYGYTALYLAVEKGYIAVVQELIRKGADVNRTYFMIINPLHIAVKNRDSNMIKLLVNNGAEMLITADGLSLHYAVNQGYDDVVSLLLDTGVAKIGDYNVDGLTALHVAVMSGHLDMAKLCLRYGADVDARCSINNLSPLYYATAKGNRRMVKLLVDNGANVDTWICDCSTLLDHAIVWRNEAIARIFIEKGAVTNVLRTDEVEDAHLAIKILAELVFKDPNMLKIAKRNWDDIQASANHKAYYDLCVRELKKMRDVKIFNHVTFGDLMIKNSNKTAAYGRNEEFVNGFLQSGYKQLFPIYATVLSLKYAKAVLRGKLLKEAEDRLVNLETFGLPALCAQNVLENLENDELKNFKRGVSKGKDEKDSETKIYINF